MKVSFTGTQRGMTEQQKAKVRARLIGLRPTAVVHGGCIGADDEFDEIAAKLGIDRYVFPCDIESKRIPDNVLRMRTGSNVVIMPPKPPLERNKTIVMAGDILLVCPKEKSEILRSGTWSTYRYGKKQVSWRAYDVELILP